MKKIILVVLLMFVDWLPLDKMKKNIVHDKHQINLFLNIAMGWLQR